MKIFIDKSTENASGDDRSMLQPKYVFRLAFRLSHTAQRIQMIYNDC